MGNVSWRTEKVVTCAFCGGEARGNLDASADIICSICVLRLCNTSSDVLKRAYERLIEKGNLRRAKLLESFIRGGKSDVRAKSITEKAAADKRDSGRGLIDRIGHERVARFIDKQGC